MESVASKSGYLARKRKSRLVASEQSLDEYGTWLCSSGLARESSKGFVCALDKTLQKSKSKTVNTVLTDMRMLLTSNPILAQDICLDYQQHMRSHYEKLLPATATSKKKQRTQT
jgi:Tfp pilus assembly protein PilF